MTMDEDRYSDIPNLQQRNLNVYQWLVSLTTDKPMINQWLPVNEMDQIDHLKEFYKDAKPKETASIWVWIIGCTAVVLLSILLVIVIFAKIYKWKINHGKNYTLKGILKTSSQEDNKLKQNQGDFNPYEKPVCDVELNEVHIYQKGRRVTIEGNEQILLFNNVSLGTDSYRCSTIPRDNKSLPACQSTPRLNQLNGKCGPNRTGSPCWKITNSLKPINSNKKNTSVVVKSEKKPVGSQESLTDISKHLNEFQTRPLPPLPTSPDVSFYNWSSAFHPQNNIFNYSFEEYYKTSSRDAAGVKLEEINEMDTRLNNSSRDSSMDLVEFSSKHLNTFIDFEKQTTTLTRKPKLSHLRRTRSNSMQEKYLSSDIINEYKEEDILRRSYSVDQLDNSLTNSPYIDMKSCEELRSEKFQETCDSYLSDSTFTSPRDGGLASFTSLHNISQEDNENMYAKIPEIPSYNEKNVKIQKRQLPPVPTLLDTCFMNRNPAENHIYQRPYFLDINSLLKCKDDEESEYLTGQLHSFRSTYSNASGQYAKIPEERDILRVSNHYTQILPFDSHC